MNMNSQIVLREYQKQDFDALADVVRKTWKYDEFCSPKTAKMLAGVYLHSCLANQTFTQVAVVDGAVSGIIMGKNIRTYKPRLVQKLRMALSIASFLLTRDGRASARIFKNVNQIDRELLEDCRNDYDGEIAFFAVGPECRGKGIGKLLFESVLRYMNDQQIKNLFLFTDTSCNYGFYEHQGMTRRSQKVHTFRLGNQREEMTFFVYDYTCQADA